MKNGQVTENNHLISFERKTIITKDVVNDYGLNYCRQIRYFHLNLKYLLQNNNVESIHYVLRAVSMIEGDLSFFFALLSKLLSDAPFLCK